MKIKAHDRSALLKLIGRFADQRILLLGDLVADEFIHGEIARVSREAPVLILKERERRIVPGGGANAANNLVDLGAQLILAGVVGEDEAGDSLLRYFERKGVSTGRVQRRADYCTPTKSRILGAVGHARPQQVVRVDREPAKKLGSDVRRSLHDAVDPRAAAALLISDYGYGAVDARLVESLRRRLRRRRTPITVDSRYDLLNYKRVTASTPNEPEIEAAFGEPIGSDVSALYRLAAAVLRHQALEALLVTRGRDGMVLFEPGKVPQHLPIFGSDQVVDVTGAGDTVIAAFTLALAAGASFLHAAMLANCAGGLVVMKSGTATISADELSEAIRNG